MNRLDIVDEAIEDLRIDMRKTVTVTNLYNQMKHKTNVESWK